MTDEQRTDSTSAYGGQPAVKTPNIDRIAERGCLFTNAFCQGPISMASRASIMTGPYCHSIGIMNNDTRVSLPPGEVVPPGLFLNAGYHTANTGKIHFARRGPTNCTGFLLSQWPGSPLRVRHDGYEGDEISGLPLGKTRSELEIIIYGTHPMPRDQTESAAITDRAIKYLTSREYGENPFFLRVSYEDPHSPILPPRPFDTQYSAKELNIPRPLPEDIASLPLILARHRELYRGWADIRPFEQARMCVAYYGLVAHVDNQVGRLLDVISDLGLLDNTAIIFYS